MAKRTLIRIEDVADFHHLASAAHRAGKAKRHRMEVAEFFDALETNLAQLREEILSGQPRVGQARTFTICDPKPRVIHAPFFRERVLHHALIGLVGPVLDRRLVDDSYACRVGRGAIKAMKRAQHFARRYPWYCKMDVRKYFASIDHAVLLGSLCKALKGTDVLAMIWHIISSHETDPGKGLPIGALTSQVLANYYLNPLDRYLTGLPEVTGYVRYMDDIVCWGLSRSAMLACREKAITFAARRLKLTMKPAIQINRDAFGLPIAGYRVYPGMVRLGKRRRRRYREICAEAERNYQSGMLTPVEFQRRLDTARALTLHADAIAWRRRLCQDSAARDEVRKTELG